MRQLIVVLSVAATLSLVPAGTTLQPLQLFANSQQSSSPPPQHEHQHAQTPPAKQGMQDMKKMHQEMMNEMKAADAKLDQLVQQMNSASGDAKVNAIATVVTELVRQQKAMHEHMGKMHEHMASGMMKR